MSGEPIFSIPLKKNKKATGTGQANFFIFFFKTLHAKALRPTSFTNTTNFSSFCLSPLFPGENKGKAKKDGNIFLSGTFSLALNRKNLVQNLFKLLPLSRKPLLIW